jgi:hypothetical protein
VVQLKFLGNGRVQRIGYEEPVLYLVAENPKTRVIVLKRYGYFTNHSGIRGMPNNVYNPLAFSVYRVTSAEPVFGNRGRENMTVDCELMIEWEPRARR